MLEEFDAAWRDCRAQMSEVARDPERLVADEQECRNHEPDERSGDVPGKRMH
jgi:hypothetical protein